MYSLQSHHSNDTPSHLPPKLDTGVVVVLPNRTVLRDSCEHECCAHLALPPVNEISADMMSNLNSLSEETAPYTPITKLQNLIHRMTYMGHTAMTFCMAGLGGVFYQITQSHCFECWATRLLPCALIASVSGLLCRAFDKRRSELIEQAKESQSFPAEPMVGNELGDHYDQK
jgi:hypothetical protein